MLELFIGVRIGDGDGGGTSWIAGRRPGQLPFLLQRPAAWPLMSFCAHRGLQAIRSAPKNRTSAAGRQTQSGPKWRRRRRRCHHRHHRQCELRMNSSSMASHQSSSATPLIETSAKETNEVAAISGHAPGAAPAAVTQDEQAFLLLHGAAQAPETKTNWWRLLLLLL